MKRMSRRNVRILIAVTVVLLIPLVLYAASEQGADGLYDFKPSSTISSGEVNHNFDTLGEFMTTYEDAITVDGNGNVGVGTSSPEGRLHVHQSEASANYMYLTNGTTGGTKTDGMYVGASSTGNGYVMNSEAQSLVLGTSATERMRIDAAGNVGIGTTSPGARLEVAGGDIKFSSDCTGAISASGRRLLSGCGGSTYLRLAGSSPAKMFISDDTATDVSIAAGGGNVGIRTSTPSAPLDVQAVLDNVAPSGLIVRRNTSQYLRMHETGGGAHAIEAVDPSGNQKSFFVAKVTSGGAATAGLSDIVLGFRQVDSSGYINADHWAMTIQAGTGNVGIGITSPAYPLDVNGQIRATNVAVTSDRRLKKNIIPLRDALEGIECLQGVTYTMRDPKVSQDTQLGLIAQDVEKCFPEVVSTDANGMKAVSYDRLVAPLIEAVKEQQGTIHQLQQETRRLNQVQSEQKAQLDALRNEVRALAKLNRH